MLLGESMLRMPAKAIGDALVTSVPLTAKAYPPVGAAVAVCISMVPVPEIVSVLVGSAAISA